MSLLHWVMMNNHLTESDKAFTGRYNRIEDDYQLKVAKESIDKAFEKNAWIEIQIRTPSTRTSKQNNALWLFCNQISDELNKNGLDMRDVLSPKIFMEWTGDQVMQRIWKPVMKVHCNKTSTTRLEKKEVTEIADILTRHFGETHGIVVVFPSDES